METKRVLLIGIDPKLIDLSNVPDLDAEKIKSAGQDSERILRELGFEPRILPFTGGPTGDVDPCIAPDQSY